MGWSILLLAACQQKQKQPLLELVPPSASGLDFINQLEETDSMNIIQYLYFYNGGGVGVGDFNGDGLPDLFLTANQGANKLYLNDGDFQFRDITDQAGITQAGNWSTGVNVVDVNGDGRLDIYICQVGNYKAFRGRNQLFIHQGLRDGIPYFEEQAADFGLDHAGFSTQSAFFDYDRDGDLDMYLLCHSVHSTETYRDTSLTRRSNDRAGDKLYHNEGPDASGQIFFTEVSEAAGINSGIAGYGLSVTIGDIDQNGYPDIYVGNDFHENDFLYLNQGDGTFREAIAEATGHTSNFSMGSDVADINNDGWLDVMTLDMKPESEYELKNAQGSDPYDIYRFKRSFGYHDQLPRNMLQLNQQLDPTGQVRFSEQGQLAGVDATDWSWSVLMADLDNDTWKDLYITNGIIRRPNNLDYLNFIASEKVQAQATDLELAAQMPNGKVRNYLYRNTGKFPMVHQKDWLEIPPSYSNGAAIVDLDLDGDLDLVTNNINEPAFLHRNRAEKLREHHYLQIKLEYPGPNPFAIGARVSLWAKGALQTQTLAPVRGFQSSQGYTLHFGLGNAEEVDSIRVVWPDGQSTQYTAVAVDQQLLIRPGNGKPYRPKSTFETPIFAGTSGRLPSPFQHRENLFYDNKREGLIPYLLSTQGPKMASADVNQDGLMDIFIGGASGQTGQLLLQDEAGLFIPAALPDLFPHQKSEDTAICFFDADGDGDQDLLVGAGGNEFYRDDPALQDRLYLNDGKGNFRYAPGALPQYFGQTACIRPADYDQDGDIDLFVGIRSVPVSYGLSPDSYLLENKGDARFEVNQTAMPQLEGLGMVTDAQWTDTDQDGDLDLVVVGDWMPITLFRQQSDGFVMEPLEHTAGWWNTIEIVDIDADGDEDWLVGNFGWNSTLQPTVEEPIRLYLGDIDGNLSRDPILTYYRDGKEYTIEDLDGLTKQLVFLKKRFRQYEKFASSTFSEVFDENDLAQVQVKEIQTLASSLVLNQGGQTFEVNALPMAAQVAPVFAIQSADFNEDGRLDLLLGGNFYEVKPSIGRMDASLGTLLLGQESGDFLPMANAEANLWLDGAVRDFESLASAEGSLLFVARNNANLQVFRYRLSPKKAKQDLID